jgi:hypothetical protein
MINLYRNDNTGALRVANQSPRIGNRDGGEWTLLRAGVTSREECETVASLAYTYGGAYPKNAQPWHWEAPRNGYRIGPAPETAATMPWTMPL